MDAASLPNEETEEDGTAGALAPASEMGTGPGLLQIFYAIPAKHRKISNASCPPHWYPRPWPLSPRHAAASYTQDTALGLADKRPEA